MHPYSVQVHQNEEHLLGTQATVPGSVASKNMASTTTLTQKIDLFIAKKYS